MSNKYMFFFKLIDLNQKPRERLKVHGSNAQFIVCNLVLVMNIAKILLIKYYLTVIE